MTDPVREMMSSDAASRMLGIELVDHAPGTAVTRMTVRAGMANGHDIAHGAVVFAVADTAFACACNGWGAVTVAAAAEIVFVSPARTGEQLTATAAVRTRFGRSGVYDVTVTADNGRVVAEFRGRSAELRS